MTPRHIATGLLLILAAGCDSAEPEPLESEFRTMDLQSPLDAVAVPIPGDAICSIDVKNKGNKAMETEYLPNVLACEAPGQAGLEMLKAQAIAARSYAYYHAIANGEICNGQGCQVFSCGRTPTELHKQAVEETSGVILRYNENLTIGFYVAGDSSPDSQCVGNSSGVANTERWVTYNEGKSGDDIDQSRIAWRHKPSDRDWGQNRGALSQWGAHCLAENMDYSSTDILRFFYGDDVEFQQTEGSCVNADDVDIDEDTMASQCPAVSAEEESIIDNEDDCFRLSGPREFWRTEDAGEGGSLRWTKSTRVSESNVATWGLNFERSGKYQLEVHIDPDHTTATDAQYEIIAGGFSTKVDIDQTEGGWLDLGSYGFEADETGQRVVMTDAIGVRGQILQADALRITPSDEEACVDVDCRADAIDPQAGISNRGDSEAGCNVGGDRRSLGLAPLGLLVLLGLRRRR